MDLRPIETAFSQQGLVLVLAIALNAFAQLLDGIGLNIDDVITRGFNHLFRIPEGFLQTEMRSLGEQTALGCKPAWGL